MNYYLDYVCRLMQDRNSRVSHKFCGEFWCNNSYTVVSLTLEKTFQFNLPYLIVSKCK